MRILAFYPYVPYPLDRGAYYRGFYLLKALAQQHDVDLLALAENGDGLAHKPVFTEFCHRVELLPFQHPGWQKLFPNRLLNRLPATVAHWTLPAAQQALGRLLATEHYDALHVFDTILAQYALPHPVPLVADRTRVDLQYQLMERRRMRFPWKARLLNLENLAKLWRYERRIARHSRLHIVCGPDDFEFVRKRISASLPMAVIPNGVDTSYFRPDAFAQQALSTEPTLLFCGAMDYNPNIDALRWYFAELHKSLSQRCPQLRLLIVGKDPSPEVRAYAARSNVTVTGAVPDVRPYYRRAWLQMVPLRIGGGTRLKIVESMAMATPVVSTTIGAQGLSLRHDHDFLMADSAEAFVRETARALTDAQLRERLAVAGLETVRARLAWPTLGEQLCRVYSEHFCGVQPSRRTPRNLAGVAA